MLPITKKITQINSGSRNGNSIQYIVCHYTGNVTDSARSNATYFYSEYRGASAHYFVDDNSIYQVVEDNRCSWAVGDGYGIYGITNQNSISIEMCCTNKVISEKTENNAIELVKYLMDKYKIDINHVVRHYDASHKICPNWSDNNWNRWTIFKNKLETVITPIFYRHQKDFENKLTNTQVSQYANDIECVFSLKNDILHSELTIRYNGYAKFKIEIQHSGLDSAENTKMEIPLKDMTNKLLITLLKQLKDEYKKTAFAKGNEDA